MRLSGGCAGAVGGGPGAADERGGWPHLNRRGPKNVGCCFSMTRRSGFSRRRLMWWFPEGAGGDRFEEQIFKGRWRMTRGFGLASSAIFCANGHQHPHRAEATRV